MTEFESFALDHQKHHHCVACGGCLLDPRIVKTQGLGIPAWCKGCMVRIDAAMPKSAPRPWENGILYS